MLPRQSAFKQTSCAPIVQWRKELYNSSLIGWLWPEESHQGFTHSEFCLSHLKGIVPHFGKYNYSLSWWELDKKINTTLISVCEAQCKATAKRHRALCKERKKSLRRSERGDKLLKAFWIKKSVTSEVTVVWWHTLRFCPPKDDFSPLKTFILLCLFWEKSLTFLRVFFLKIFKNLHMQILFVVEHWKWSYGSPGAWSC